LAWAAASVAEIAGDFVHAEHVHHLGVRLHLGRGPLAPGIGLDLLLEVRRAHARDDRHEVGPAIAGGAVARRARERLGEARIIERPRRRRAGKRTASKPDGDGNEALHRSHEVLPKT
jgi:hypothetical protein